jgi:RNA-directed DNA polymerase
MNGKAMDQMPGKRTNANSGRHAVGQGETLSGVCSNQATPTHRETLNTGQGLLQAALDRGNLQSAFKRVRRNKGSAGVDGLDIDQTAEHLKTEWPRIRQELLEGRYKPSLVRRVQIPKPDGSWRELGIPTVTDRLIQQALLQILQPLIDPAFSEHSHGFRPARSARDAILKAQQYVQSGKRVVVDVDLEKFFDRVNHDILMDRVRKRISDPRVVRLIRAYLKQRHYGRWGLQGQSRRHAARRALVPLACKSATGRRGQRVGAQGALLCTLCR